jgi:2-amino-4-hydroxy-6-hydroxymethyldihydropteridine diphosphokinase
MARVYISIGSNINRRQHIGCAVNALRSVYGELTLSSVFENPAVGFKGRPFYNLVAGLTTSADLMTTVIYLRQLEFRWGRAEHSNKGGSRTVDLDLLTFGQLVGRFPLTTDAPYSRQLTPDYIQLPRPEFENCAFVLKPLAQVAANEQHPLLKQSYSQLWAKLNPLNPLTPVDFDWQP